MHNKTEQKNTKVEHGTFSGRKICFKVKCKRNKQKKNNIKSTKQQPANKHQNEKEQQN